MVSLVGTDISFDTLIDLLEFRAKTQKQKTLYEFISDTNTSTLTYQELATKAKAIAVELQKNHLKPGQRAILIYPPGLELITAFFGCLYAGVIAVPVYPPLNEKLVEKLQHIIIDCKADIILLTDDIFKKLKQLKQSNKLPIPVTEWDLEKIHWVTTDIIPTANSQRWQHPNTKTNDLAFLQYTSGSTGDPKGVMVSHGNLLHNLFTIQHATNLNPKSRAVIWLPPYHDMGLIGGILQPLWVGFPISLMSPVLFLKNPFLWLKIISEKKATVTSGPNFCYELCAQKVTIEQKKEFRSK